ncbi:MAG: hypothetical protein COA38_14940 [Fluviicola sp.]|nr:MAG: hypothetical protein COA38_14940 [Fluviicola sp.]
MIPSNDNFQKFYNPKGVLMLLGILIIGTVSFAQPSDASILNKLKTGGNNPDLISISLIGERPGIREEVENNTKVFNFYRSYKAKMKTEYPGVTRTYRGMIKYGKRLGSWTYIQKLVGDESYEGIPNPTWGEIEQTLKGNMKNTFGSALYAQIVGEISDFKLANEPNWHWHSMSSVEFMVTATYSQKVNYTDLEKITETFSIRLYADAYKAPWNSTFLRGNGTKVSLGKTTYSKDELASMRTLKQINIEQSTAIELANLPSIEIPSYSNHTQLMMHFHSLLMTAEGPMIEAYLRKTLTSGYFDSQMTTVLNDRGVKLVNKVVALSVRYRSQYCTDPQVKHTQSNMIEWFNKDASTNSRVASIDLGNGVRGISEISLSVNNTDSEKGKVLAEMSCKTRTNPLLRMKESKLNSVMGAYVFCRYGTSEWYYVGQINGATNSGYKIKWMDGSSSNEPKSSLLNYDLVSGDLVYVKNSRGNVVARWISENNGTTIVNVEDLNGKQTSVHVKDLRFK